MRGALAVALLFAAVACAATKERVAEPEPASLACDAPVADGVELSETDRCVLELYRARCNENDVCIVDCLVNGEGENIAGGCWHVCFAYSESEWTLPEGFEDCR